MTIAESREKCKIFLARVPRDFIIVAILILASSASFGLGYLAGTDAGQGTGSTDLPSFIGTTTDGTGQSQAGEVVASKNGTKYYFSSCAGASRISDANKVWFTTASAAMEAGYTLAANCKSP